MSSRKTWLLVGSSMMVTCLIALGGCRRSGDVGRAAAETAAPWTLSMAAPIDHLDVVAGEPMIVEHPDGTLFVAGFGASYQDRKKTDEPTLWKSQDGGTTWVRVNVGTEADGAAGNSDVDLAVASDGTVYFATLVYDVKADAGQQISLGVSKDAGATWKWTLLSKTRFDDRPWVEVAPDGTAHVIWNDGVGVCHAVSQDGGRTWTERGRIHPKGGSSHLAVGPKGEVAVRVVPPSASGNKYDEGVDLVAVSTDGGMTWQKHAAPGTREWNPQNLFPVPRWVEPLAWDERGVLYSFWTNLDGIWLARSADQGATWTTWRLAESPEVAYYPYLVARGRGELAATWFSGWTGTWCAHVARIDVGEGEAAPRFVEAPPFSPNSRRTNPSWPDDPLIRDTAGEYLALCFLRNGGLAVVSPIKNKRENRYGFSLWKVEERRGEPSPRITSKDEGRSGAGKPEKVYSESPAAWYDAASDQARISADGKWALYYRPLMHKMKLINLETGREDAKEFTAGLDRVFNAVFYQGSQLARLGQRGGQQGWFLPGPDGLRLFSLPSDAIPQWSRDGSAVAYFRLRQGDQGLFVGDSRGLKRYPVEGSITSFAWAPDGQSIYALAWHENGLTSLVHIHLETGSSEILARDLDASPLVSDLVVSGDGRHLYAALAGPTAPVAEARHQPDADRDLDIYELDPATGARHAVVQAPGDDFGLSLANGFLYWMHNDIHDSVVAVPASGGPARLVEDYAEIPYWDNDGKRIAFTYGPWRLADWALNLDAGVVSVDSQARPQSKMKPIVTGYHEDFPPTWSPDGKWIAYHSHRSPTPVSSYDAAGSSDDIYLRRASGGPKDEIRLTNFGLEVGVPSWSPDGRRLVFDSWERGGPEGVSKPWIVTIDPSTGEPGHVERLPLPDPIKRAHWESWSPKGDEIAFAERTEGNGCILWVVSTDGKRAEKLAEYLTSTSGGLDWTPDGKTIVYGALAGERMQIFAVPRSGGPARQLTDDPANLMHPQVSPDGCWIACTRMDQTKEIRGMRF